MCAQLLLAKNNWSYEQALLYMHLRVVTSRCTKLSTPWKLCATFPFFLNEVCHNFSVAQIHVNTVILAVVHADMKFMTSWQLIYSTIPPKCRKVNAQSKRTMFTCACATLELCHTSFRKTSNVSLKYQSNFRRCLNTNPLSKQ